METKSTTFSASKKQWLEDLALAGFALMPLIPGTKEANIQQWTGIAPNPLQSAKDFPDNYGVILPPDVAVIDIDPRGFEDGIDSYAKLCSDLHIPQEPDTYTVQSRPAEGRLRAGQHIYFKRPLGLNLRTELKKIYPGVQLKGFGSYLVGPGSIHPDTKKPYIVVKGGLDNLAPLPEAVIEMYSYSIERMGTALGDAVDDEVTRKRYRRYLKKAPPAIQNYGGDNQTLAVALVGRDFGLSEEATFEELFQYYNPKCQPEWAPSELAVKVKNAYLYPKDALGNRHPKADFDAIPYTEEELKYKQWVQDRREAEKSAGIVWEMNYNSSGQITSIKNSIPNILNAFNIPNNQTFVNELYGLIRRNEFDDRIEFTRRPSWHSGYESMAWTMRDAIALVYKLSTEFRSVTGDRRRNIYWTPTKESVYDAVSLVADSNPYHPVKAYVESIKWDGVGRISKLFSRYAGAKNNKYVRAVSRAVMIAMIARVYKPGCKFDYLPIIEGAQGIGKSTFCSILGGEWYADIHLDPHSKDTVMNLQGKLLVELSELTHIKKSDAEAIKQFLSKQFDVFRPPYGREAINVPRQSILIGTFNPDGANQYLTDHTGNRRMWPIEATVIKLDELKRDRDQLFAEAFVAYKKGEPFYLKEEEVQRIAEDEQLKRLVGDPWVDTISTWIARETKTNELPNMLYTSDLLTEVLNIPAARQRPQDQARVKRVMVGLGWEYGSFRGDKIKRRGFKRPTLDKSDDILTGL